MISIEDFNAILPGTVISTGVLPNDETDLFMTRDGGELRWVSIKGYGDDWCIYCHWSYHPVEWIKTNGDKIMAEKYIYIS